MRTRSNSGYTLGELVIVLGLFTFWGLVLWVTVHFLAKVW